MPLHIVTSNNNPLRVLLLIGLGMLVWILSGINELLVLVIELLEWSFTFRKKCDKWLEDVKDCTNDRVAAYLRIINRNNRGEVLPRNVTFCELNGRHHLQFHLPIAWQDEHLGVRKFELGKPSSFEVQKNVIVIGADGCYKRYFIDAMANHALGITWEDHFSIGLRRPADLTFSKRDKPIDIYTIPSTNETKMHFTVNVVNLPNFTANQRSQDINELFDKLMTLLESPSGHGIDCFHSVVFVYHTDHGRELTLYRDMYQKLKSKFGDQVKGCFTSLLSCSTVEETATEIFQEKMRQAGIQCANVQPFYPSNFYKQEKSQCPNEMELQYNKVHATVARFINNLEASGPNSLTISPENLDKRNRATEGVQQLHSLIRVSCQQISNTMTEIERIKEESREKTYISEVQNFKYVKAIPQKEKRELSYEGEAVTNCSVCFMTCHDRCGIKEDEGKARCSSMANGYCTKCPGKCFWDQHFNRAFIITVKMQQVEESFMDIAGRFNMDGTKKVSDLLDALSTEKETKEKHVAEYMKKIIHNSSVIAETSGRPQPDQVGCALEEIILGEKRGEEGGWEERVQLLQKIKEKLEVELRLEGLDVHKKVQ